MNHPETSASFRALAESALAFAVGQVLGLGLVAEHKLEAGLGIVLLSPFFVLCLIPACLARLYHEAWRHTLSRGAYVALWFVAGFLFSCGWGLAFVNARGPVLLDALDLLGGGTLRLVMGLAYWGLGPFVSPLIVAVVVPRRFRLHSSPTGAV